MKRRMLLLLAAASLGGCPIRSLNVLPDNPLEPADGDSVRGQQATLRAAVPAGGVGTFELRARRADRTRRDFTIVALPDTQFYCSDYPETFFAQSQWILDHRESDNIVAVLHLGDIVDNADDTGQWDVADAAIGMLESEPNLPILLSVGNHDQSPNGEPKGTQNFNRYFPASRFASRRWYGGHYGDDNDNHYILFEGGGLKLVAVTLEFDESPNADVIAWADGVLKAHADRKAIVVTHFAMLSDLVLNVPSKQGRTLLEKLAADNPNVIMMLGGHFCETGRRFDVFGGRVVYTVLADYQCRPGGGGGWMRVMRFSPADNVVRVRTISPTKDAELTRRRHRFELPLELDGFARVASQVRGRVIEGTLDGLEPGGSYEWFVRWRLGPVVVDGPVWGFKSE